MTLIEARIAVCQEILSELQKFLSHLSPDLSPKYEKLVSILRSLSALNTRSKASFTQSPLITESNGQVQFPDTEVDDLVQHVKEIEESLELKKECKDGMSLEEYYDGLAKFKENTAPQEEKLVTELLTRCLLWAKIIKERLVCIQGIPSVEIFSKLFRRGKIDERFKDTYEQLLSIRNKLESLSLTHAWSLRETDLYGYQRKLDRIDEARVNGNFLDGLGKPADLHAQRVS